LAEIGWESPEFNSLWVGYPPFPEWPAARHRVSSEVKPVIEAVVAEKLQEFLLENPGEAKTITGEIIDATRSS
jgi:hypothetical protein